MMPITWLSQHWAEGAMAFVLTRIFCGWVLRNRASISPLTSAPSKGLFVAFLVALLVPWVPIGAHVLSPASIVSGMVGELSSLTLVWCLFQVFAAPPNKLPAKFYLPYLIAAFALAWSTLSYVGPDVYRWGFLNGTEVQLSMLASLVLLSCWLPVRLSLALGLATISWALGFQASTNLWDYLIDVPSAVFIAVRLARSLLLRTSHA
jgi:hypothetical protein